MRGTGQDAVGTLTDSDLLLPPRRSTRLRPTPPVYLLHFEFFIPPET